jgi:hypothetical protein
LGEDGDETLLCGEVIVRGVGVQLLRFWGSGLELVVVDIGDEILAREETVRAGVQMLLFLVDEIETKEDL